MQTTRIVEFKTHYRAGKPPVDMVLLAPAGPAYERTRTWHRIKDLMPPDYVDDTTRNGLSYQALAARWEIVEPAYAAWKSGNEIPETGTPLGAWPGVTRDQSDSMRRLGVKTVEDVKAMSERALEQLNWPGARELPKLAAAFLDGTSAAEKDAKIEEMQARMEAMEEMLEARVADKPRRGRPPKEADAA